MHPNKEYALRRLMRLGLLLNGTNHFLASCAKDYAPLVLYRRQVSENARYVSTIGMPCTKDRPRVFQFATRLTKFITDADAEPLSLLNVACVSECVPNEVLSADVSQLEKIENLLKFELDLLRSLPLPAAAVAST